MSDRDDDNEEFEVISKAEVLMAEFEVAMNLEAENCKG